MKLYYFETPNSRKPCAVARYLRLPVEHLRVDLARREQRRPEFLAINPNGKVPVLVDGPTTLWEGHAIMVHLAVAARSDLWPRSAAEQVDVLRWLNWDTAHFSRHAGTMLFENHIKASLGLGATDPGAVENALKFFHQFAAVLDGYLASRRYLVGDRLTVADFGVASFLPQAREGRLPLQDYGNVQRWHERLMEIPAWANPYPDTTAAAVA